MPALGRISRLHVAASPFGHADEAVGFVGPLCTPLDWWQRNADGPVGTGQLIVVLNVGAYGQTASLVVLPEQGVPAEVVLDGDAVVDARCYGWHAARCPWDPHNPSSVSQPTTALAIT